MEGGGAGITVLVSLSSTGGTQRSAWAYGLGGCGGKECRDIRKVRSALDCSASLAVRAVPSVSQPCAEFTSVVD